MRPSMGSTSVLLGSPVPLIVLRKSPSVKKPASFPSAPTTAADPLCAFVIAISVSMTVAVGATFASFSPVRMMSVTFMTSARPIAPAGWFIAYSSSGNFCASIITIASASPIAIVAVVEFVGAIPNGHASLPQGIRTWTSLSEASVDFGSRVSEMTLSPCRRIAGMRRIASSDSPEKLSAIRMSFAETMPRSPCIACTGFSTIERVPVEAKMALIFSAICRFLPTPVTTTMPSFLTQSSISPIASVKVASSESRVFRRPSISTSKTSRARTIICSFVILLVGALEKGHANRADDVLGAAAARQVVHGLRKALEVRSDRIRPAEALRDLVSDVAGVEVGEDEDVGVALDRAIRVLQLAGCGDDRGVELHLAVHRDARLGEPRLRELDGLLDLLDELSGGGALGGEGEIRDARLVSGEVLVRLRSGEADVDELLGRRIGIHGAVAEREHAVARRGGLAKVEDEAARRGLDALLCAQRMERRAEHVARRGDRAGDESVAAPELDHHAAEVDALRAERLLGVREADDLLLLGRLFRFLRVPSLEIRVFEFRIPRGVVDRGNAAGGEIQAGLRLGVCDFGGRAAHDDLADLAVDAGARGDDDAGVHAFGKHDRAVEFRGLFDDFLDCVHSKSWTVGKLGSWKVTSRGPSRCRGRS